MSTQPSQSFRQRHRPSLLTALGVFGVLLIFRALIGGDDAAQLENAEPLPVTALAATELASYEVEQRFVGRIAARRESEVGFELSGAVAQMRVEEGDEVASGEVLAELDQALLLARQAELEAVVTQAQAQRDLAQQSSERTRGAFAQDAVSAQALDEAEASARVAVANAAAAQASLQTVRVQLEKSALRAPYAARVARRYTDEGQVLNAGAPVFRLLERSAQDARVVVSAASAKNINVDDTFTLTIDGGEVSGRVRAIFPEREGLTRGVAVLFELQEAVEARAGDLVHLSLPQTIDDQAFRLPITALTESVRGIWAVYVAVPVTSASESGRSAISRLDRVQVEVLHQNNDEVFVRGGLRSGDRVIDSGLQRLVPGQEVRLRDRDDSNAQLGAL